MESQGASAVAGATGRIHRAARVGRPRSCDSRHLRALAAIAGDALDRSVHQEEREALRERFGVAAPVLEAAAAQHIAEHRDEIIAETLRSAGPFLEQAFADLTSQLGGLGGQAHNAELSKMLASAVHTRWEHYRTLSWSVHLFDDTPLILGDVVVVGYDPGCQEFFSAAVEFGRAGFTLLPISSRYLLVGSSVGMQALPSAEEINVAAAEMSREFFIAASSTQREAAYHSRLGMRRELLSGVAIEGLMEEALREDADEPGGSM